MKKEQIFMILPKRFISPSGTELGSFCLLDKCVSHYTGATECKILRLLHTRNADNFTILFL